MPREEQARMMKTAPMRSECDNSGLLQSFSKAPRQEPPSTGAGAAAASATGPRAVMTDAMYQPAIRGTHFRISARKLVILPK